LAFAFCFAKAQCMKSNEIRVALFSGNYNYVRDGANQALNRLAEFLLRQGVKLRVYSPTTDTPAFEPTGDLVSLPSCSFPRRKEYKFPLGLFGEAKRDLKAFTPDLVHVASPCPAGHAALRWAEKHNLPVVASVHTRFETYPRYYGLAFMEPLVEAMLRRFYRRCDAILAPSESFAQVLREQRMSYDVGIWTRGIDERIFNTTQRDMAWRRAMGIEDDMPVVGFIGRLVMEKGLDVFSDTIDILERQQVRHKVLIIGDGPARGWFENRLPNAAFAGFLTGQDLGRAAASMDMLFNPSVTEAFGNVTLESLACAVPVVAARATGSESLVQDGITGRLVRPGAVSQFAAALRNYIENADVRAAHGTAGKGFADNFRWDTVNQAMLDTYLRVLALRQRGERPPLENAAH
jgi:phosphatidylinositol alpha 1,6-mannosyltransferase